MRTVTFGFVVGLACVTFLPCNCSRPERHHGCRQGRDGGGASGVTVEAASDVLIERGRSVVSDGQGVYRIVDLRPGVYVPFPPHQHLLSKRERLALRIHPPHQRRGEMGARRNRHRHQRSRPSSTRRRRCTRKCSTARRSTRFPPAAASRAWAAHRRHQPEPARHRRRARDAADLHEHARHDARQQHRDGGRHDGQRPAGRWRRAELLQRRDEPGGELPDQRASAPRRRPAACA